MEFYQTKDYGLIARLNKTVHELHVEMYPDRFKPYDYSLMKDAFQKLMDLPHNSFFILEVNGEAVGYSWTELKIHKENAFKKEFTSLYVHQLSILKEHQSKGYGSVIMDFLIIQAKENSASVIELDYWLENKKARDFYKKIGFLVNREFAFKLI